jgi:hypothetical protein
MNTQNGLANVPESEHSKGGVCMVCSEEWGMLIVHPAEVDPLRQEVGR